MELKKLLDKKEKKKPDMNNGILLNKYEFMPHISILFKIKSVIF